MPPDGREGGNDQNTCLLRSHVLIWIVVRSTGEPRQSSRPGFGRFLVEFHSRQSWFISSGECREELGIETYVLPIPSHKQTDSTFTGMTSVQVISVMIVAEFGRYLRWSNSTFPQSLSVVVRRMQSN